MKTGLYRVFLAAIALLVIAPASAQQYPNRPVKVLIPIPAGGGPDVAARIISDKLIEVWGHPFVVENKPGGNGNVASEVLINSAPDGYTLALNADSQIIVNPHLYPDMTFDPRKDLAFVTTVAVNYFILSVNPKLPITTLPEFVEYAKKANPPLAYGSGGNGSQHHLTMEMLKQRAGIDLVHVPYRGGAPATTATISGEVAASFAGMSAGPQIKAGVVRPIAISGDKRSPVFPDVPSIAEYYPGFNNGTWLALFAPKNTPEPILERIRTAVNKVLIDPDTQERFTRVGGMQVYATDPKQFQSRIREDDDKYAAIIKRIGAKID